MQHRNTLSEPKRGHVLQASEKLGAETGPHPADLHVGRQIAVVRVQSNVSQAQLARSVGISVHQLQKYEHAKNRVSASMLHEIASSLGVPASRFFEGIPGNQTRPDAPRVPVDECIDFIAKAEGRRLIEGLMQLHPLVRGRISALVAVLGEELPVLGADKRGQMTGEFAAVEPQTSQ
ncbi:helix-turn-helix domain-containing protein [Mesorhizobium sp. M0659]|uniref:helix-turn-helix domain-containing protein n=1 Tax=Mesorhizobium sp. M0659 TaxID=2956980 RepID=UPI00333D1084